jgi:uncharacterized metal-binding protein
MPSGKTHDSLSWYFYLPFAYLAWYLTRDWMLVGLFSAAYFFSSFMFGGDLDLVSIQSKRWGLLRWMWIPYRKMIAHRSKWSHGLLLGTVFRLVYVSIFICIFYGIFYLLTLNYYPPANAELLTTTGESVNFLKNQPPAYFASLFAGLLTGAGLHTIADVSFSKVKRLFRKKKKKKTGRR